MLSLSVAALAFNPMGMFNPNANKRAAVGEQQAGKVVGAAVLAALLTMAPVDDAFAAGRSGGRVGGRAPSRPSVSRSAPSPARATNVYVAPTPMYGGGMGYGMGYGGFGGGMSTGTYLGLSLAESFIREQQRQTYLQQQLRTQQELGRDQAQIAELQRALSEQNAKVDGLRAQQAQGGQAPAAAPAAAPVDAETVRMLQQQLLQQQQQIQQLQGAK